MDTRWTPQAALAALEASGQKFRTLFGNDLLEIEVYRPIEKDEQQPHPRDEVYVVIAGSGIFMCDSVRQPFVPGEILFVPAGVAHRFEEFSEDFYTWVFFLGAEKP